MADARVGTGGQAQVPDVNIRSPGETGELVDEAEPGYRQGVDIRLVGSAGRRSIRIMRS